MFNFRFLFTLIAAFLLTDCSIAQQAKTGYVTKKTVSGKAKKYYEKGMEYNFKDDNQNAIKEFEKALKQEPRFIDAQLQWAACYYTLKDHEKAEIGFEKVLAIDPLYNKKVFYTLALTELRLKKFTEAAQHFADYIANEKKNKRLLAKATRFEKIARFKEVALKNPVPYDPKSLGSGINTEYWEYLPTLTADEQTLIYTTLRADNQEDFYISHKVDGQWQKGKPITAINTNKNEGAQSISADGKILIYTTCNRKDGYGKCDLRMAEVRNGNWTKPVNIGPPLNTRASEKQPTLSADGRTVYFASDRSGGFGGFDIWISYRLADGKWSKPVNAGPSINTDKNEYMPFIHADNQTLYFISDGHPGMGKLDIFYTRKVQDTSWQEPINLGYPINTESNESSLIVSLDGKTAYLASDRDFVPKTDNPRQRIPTDLYSFKLYEAARPQRIIYVQATVIDAITKEKLVAKVEFINLTTEATFSESFTDEDGEFLTTLPIGTDYALNVSKENYLFHSENFTLNIITDINQPAILKIELQPIPVADETIVSNKPVILRNVFFDTGAFDLRKSSFGELDRLYELLKKNDQLKIQINGHTDNVGKPADNLMLSGKRAKAVYDYLVQKGIASNRLSFKGFGETQPIESNETTAGRQSNRRTAFIIIR